MISKLKYLLPLAIVFVSIWYIFPYIENKKYNFTLQGLDEQGKEKKVKLSDFNDKNVIIFFGYLSCPDVCPTTMSTLKSAFDKLSIQEKKSLQVIFVSIDPQRDSLQEINSYIQYFIPSAIGLTDTYKNLDKLRESYGVYYVKEASDSVMSYTISHTSYLYFFKTRNRFVKKLAEHDSQEIIYQTIQEML